MRVMSAGKKSRIEAPPESPIAFRACSNGEFCPKPETALDRTARQAFFSQVEARHRRLGLSRRQFAESACGVMAALFVINQVYGCGNARRGSGGAQAHAGSAGYGVDPTMMEDLDLACEALTGPDFVMDVQVHPATPLNPWRNAPLPSTAEDFIRTLFVDSDTTVACLSGVPGARDLGRDNVEASDYLQELTDKLGKRRLIYHANIDPTRGASELAYMQELAGTYDLSAWKVYPHVGPWRLDDPLVGLPFLEQARQLNVKLIAAHRGIAADSGLFDAPSSPVDLTRAAAQMPDVKFLVYHSGWQSNIDENHAFDPQNTNPGGVDRLIKGVLDAGIGSTGNVYAELGSTWRNLMTSPNEAAHVLGKLLKHLGEDRIIWGTDSVFTGSPQEQIQAFRLFEIPIPFQELYGYPALTSAVKAKILGLNGAALYGIDPEAMRCAIKNDFVERLKLARREDPESVPVPGEKRYGPKDPEEYRRFLRWERG